MIVVAADLIVAAVLVLAVVVMPRLERPARAAVARHRARR